jgi:hypothetical protein
MGRRCGGGRFWSNGSVTAVGKDGGVGGRSAVCQGYRVSIEEIRQHAIAATHPSPVVSPVVCKRKGPLSRMSPPRTTGRDLIEVSQS